MGRSAISPARSMLRTLARIDASNCAAAFVVKVRPITPSAGTMPLPMSQAVLADIEVVLPEPAPATTTAGSSGADTTAHCSSVSEKPRA
ncbi:unannotated protein [freshwater metagenome]|uniref:Unannotated protein n=1 Tax=freshwater metagenome TaxID=449393 RepID=A0A6J7PGS8_9ZZZZ